MSNIKDFSGCKVLSTSEFLQSMNGKIVERTIRKVFPDDDESTLYIVKLKGVRAYIQLYEHEMRK